MKRQWMGCSLLAAVACSSIALAATDADVDKSFFPYRNGVPAFPGVKPGLVIGKDNVEPFRNAVDPALYQHVKDGWLEIPVGPTTSLDLHPNYVDATRKNLNKVKLGAKPGEITGFVAGRPFPEEPDLKDPRAGEKLAWNFKYLINYGDNGAITPFYWTFRDLNSGKIERRLNFSFHFLNYKHRVIEPPLPEVTPNPSQLFRGIYAKVLEPLDVKNTQLLIQRFSDDLKRDDAYLYLGFQRRVRRLATGQVTDAFLGSDLMVEDFEGYNGRISDMVWTYKGTADMLAPFFNHNEQKLSDEFKEPDGYKFIAFGGKGGCFPIVSWQMRKMYVLEARPVDPGHPISKRVYYVDAQTFTMSRTLIYDRKGELWKSFTVGKSLPDHHLPENKGSGTPVDDFFSMVDVQSKHCTTGQFKAHMGGKLTPVSLFSVQNMRGGD